ncbi:hypothetical protein [Myxococcus sp. CA039A]|uniref:hypothetical protein n=1 Tax=Myxococcus sp. CA039A TaxID=2741737 RepID=UPI00157AFBEA|nr:hypothetical protein [Myxococcus sp. CA039A]NTX54284.1 hypothetical protein [Myxococcus sp. CA039A]
MLTVRVRLVLVAVLSLITPSAAMAANAVAGTTYHGQTITAPPGTSVSDWNILLVPRNMGFQEIYSEDDNALLRFEVSASPLNNVAWSVWARFKYRNSSGPGTWYVGSVDFLLVRKALSVAGTLTHGENLAVPSGTSMADWNIIVSPASAGIEEPGLEFDNALLRFSASYTIVDNFTWQLQAPYKFRHTNQGLSFVGAGQVSYLLVSRNASFTGFASNGQTFATQGNTAVSDWSVLVLPASVGYEEVGSEGDNALLLFDSNVQVLDSYRWQAFGAYKYRYHNGGGVWYGETLSYIAVRN